jgi:hypothetical protein
MKSLSKFSHRIIFMTVLLIASGIYSESIAQIETMAWGNITVARVNEALIEFETSISVVQPDWIRISQTAKEKQQPKFERDESKAIITTSLENISFEEIIDETGQGMAKININLIADSNVTMAGTYFTLELPRKQFADASIKFIEQFTPDTVESQGENINAWTSRLRIKPVQAKGISIVSGNNRLKITSDELTEIIVRDPNPWLGSPNTIIYFALITGNALAGQSVEKKFFLKAEGKPDTTPIELALDASQPGRVFDGIGGNFRLQNEKLDPMVIDYCLNNLKVTWARVEMPWRNWHLDERVDPLEEARNGNLDESVTKAMLMAQNFKKRGIPVIISAWFPPKWAVTGEIIRRRGPDDPFGNPLDQTKMKKIIKSIGSYILFLKEKYGVEANMFSFNESDLGINVRQTGEEHAQLIKELGAYFDEHQLATKMLLGDNSDATTYNFVTPALNDPATHKYIGAVSFHSWRGCDNMTLSIWADIARELNVPLLIGEGSTDAQAWGYPDIFLESSYSINEIDLYMRALDICQAKSILQWQLTSDYSVLTGSGIYGTSGSLKPTQRFWNLKQLGLTPKGSFHLPLSGKAEEVSTVAYGDIANDIYSIHLVNNGGKRKVTITGIPGGIEKFEVYVTNSELGMRNTESVPVKNSSIEFTIEAASFTSLINE